MDIYVSPGLVAMCIDKIFDGGGKTVDVLHVDGIYLPTFSLNTLKTRDHAKKQLESVKNMGIRKDDVILLSFPRSGTHWVFETVSMVLKGLAEYEILAKDDVMLERVSLSYINSLPSPRVINTHVLLDKLPDDILKTGCKLVVILRNPKDVAVSLYTFMFNNKSYHYEGNWRDFLPMFLSDKSLYYSWFTYVRELERFQRQFPDAPILTVYYEDLMKDSSRETERIAKFFGKNYNKTLVDDIAHMCSFENLKKADLEVKENPVKLIGKDGKQVMYRKGVVGDWKNWFTVAQNELFDQVYEEKMKGSNLKFTYSI